MESQNVSAQTNYLRNIPRHAAELSTRTFKGKLSSARAEFQILAEKNRTHKLPVPLLCLLQGLNKQAAQTVQ